MFIDFLTIMLLNLTAGLVVFGFLIFKWRNLENISKGQFVPGFAITGLIGIVTGFVMIFTWPLPGSFNIAFGEMSLLFSVLFAGVALALAKDWDLITVTMYAIFPGAAAILLGLRIINLELTKEPMMSALGFIFTGILGVISTPAYLLRKSRIMTIIALIILAIAVIIWITTTYGSYWGHMESFSKWVPVHMRGQ
jgi:putative membrane protein